MAQLRKATEPLAQHARLRSRDAAEVRDSVAQVFCPHALQPRRARQRLDAHHNMVRLGQTGLNFLTYGTDVRIEPGCLEHFYLVQMPLRGAAEITCGQQYVWSDPATASLLNPADDTRMRWHEGNQQLLLWVPRQALEDRLAEHLGHPLIEPLRFQVALPQREGHTQAWCQMLKHLVSTIDEAGTGWLQFQATVAGLEDSLMRGLLQLHQHNYSNQLNQPAAAALPRHVQRAIEYIEAHLQDAVSVANLAAAACVSIRALEEGFKRHCQCTPMQYLRNRRLDVIHQRLSGGIGEPPAITLLAHQYGFIHLGRFAAYYKARFGESPSATVRRRLQAH